jgi:predicted enzyme related to lactoylglutathione lyase
MSDASLGSFVWYDLLTTDPKAAVSFYREVVGWESQALGPEYAVFAASQGPLAGTTTLPERAKKAGAPPHWVSNVSVTDVEATLAQAERLGARLISEPSDYPNVGRLAVIADAQGAVINVFKPNQAMKPHDSSKPGEFTWSELLTTEHESAFRFYATLFGWKKQRDFDMGAMGKYLIFGIGDKDLGGMFTKPKDMPAPPHCLNGPMEVPGGARIAQLDDPQGAGFALHELPKKA